MSSPLKTILEGVTAFAKYVDAEDFVAPFLVAHPELIDEHHPDAPPEAPTDDVDPDVRDAIEKGEA